MGQNLVVTAMVLNVMPIGEYDKRIMLLTSERGKITAFARGARRPNSQLLAATNPFVFGEFELFEGRSSYTVSKVTVKNYFRELSEDFEAAYYGFYFLEFADYYCQENSDEKEMLKLLYQSLRALESPSFDHRLVRVVFELKAIAINGEAPNVFACAGCGTKEELLYFSARRACVLCKACIHRQEIHGGTELYRRQEESTIYTMQYIIASPVTKLYTFSVSQKVLGELIQNLNEYRKFYIEHTFKSLKILEEMTSCKI